MKETTNIYAVLIPVMLCFFAMGLFGGTIFPLAMGVCSDWVGGQSGAIACMAVGVIYLFFYITQIKK